MSGCTNCSSKGGCDSRKGKERELLAELLPKVYPTRRWGAPDDAARYGASLSEAEGRRLARQAAETLHARTYFRPGDAHELCDYVYVLCVGREPGLFELRDAPTIDVPAVEQIREKYLRLAISTVAPVAALQEVTFELDREGDVYVVRELPRPGVYDPILLKRTQKLINLAVDAGLHYLDFALILKGPEVYDPSATWDGGGYQDEYGQEPGVVNYLFSPQPPTAVTASFVPCAPAPSA